MNYSASVVKTYNATTYSAFWKHKYLLQFEETNLAYYNAYNSIACFRIKIVVFYFKKRSSLLSFRCRFLPPMVRVTLPRWPTPNCWCERASGVPRPTSRYRQSPEADLFGRYLDKPPDILSTDTSPSNIFSMYSHFVHRHFVHSNLIYHHLVFRHFIYRLFADIYYFNILSSMHQHFFNLRSVYCWPNLANPTWT
jgi:hypothetical protein